MHGRRLVLSYSERGAGRPGTLLVPYSTYVCAGSTAQARPAEHGAARGRRVTEKQYIADRTAARVRYSKV